MIFKEMGRVEQSEWGGAMRAVHEAIDAAKRAMGKAPARVDTGPKLTEPWKSVLFVLFARLLFVSFAVVAHASLCRRHLFVPQVARHL